MGIERAANAEVPGQAILAIRWAAVAVDSRGSVSKSATNEKAVPNVWCTI
jgi:hypothetical protein